MTMIYEGRATVEYSEGNDTLYISGKKGVVVRIKGLKLTEDIKNMTMLDIEVSGSQTVIVGGPSAQPASPP